MVGAHRTDVGMALAFSPWWRRTARPCSAHRTPRSARLYLKTVSSDHARAIGIRTDEVPAADALTCVLVLTAEPVPLVSSDRRRCVWPTCDEVSTQPRPRLWPESR
jgi:hypothetical protein